MSLRIYDVPQEMVTDFWSAVEPMLVRAIDLHPHMDTAGMLHIVISGFAQLIVATLDGQIQAAAIMERVQYPRHIVGNILALAGKAGTAPHMDALSVHCEQWARARGCDRIAFVGRPGLSKIARKRRGNTITLVHAWRDLGATS